MNKNGLKLTLAMIVLTFFSKNSFSEGWNSGHFKLGDNKGREIFIDPSGKPFYSIAMCYAWGPEAGAVSKEPNLPKKAIRELEFMKKHGFNTMNLYGLDNLEEILTWCDKNEMAFYPRMNYYELSDFPQALKDYPDFMSQNFRKAAKSYFDKFCPIFKKHPSVLAIDMDQRWLFGLEWSGEKRSGEPMLAPESVKYMPKYFENKYRDIDALNKLWEKNYRSFDEMLGDSEIVKGGIIQKLKKYPWRADIYEYTLWTINDFLKEMTGYIRTIDIPSRLITYTSELPEACPFQLSTKENSGIDFVSPVHYNSQQDFDRDWIGLGELLYMTKFHSDLQKMPSYISETGFRTSPLKQKPPFMMYAAGKTGDETFIAEMYLRQTALLDLWPWMTGWTHFKLYDKLMEGDFGYIRDDRSLKPISALGEYINKALSTHIDRKEKEPAVWIFYPEYCLASPYASYQQFKSLVLILEHDFLKEFERMIAQAMPFIKNPSAEITKSDIVLKLADLFDEKWVPFKFTSEVPNDDKPVLIAGRSLEQLSLSDREKLKEKKVITFVQAGIEDERYHKTERWFLSLLGIDPAKLKLKVTHAGLAQQFNNNSEKDLALNTDSFPATGKELKCPKGDASFMLTKENIECRGQTIQCDPKPYGKIDFLAAAIGGDVTDRIGLTYSDGSSESKYLAEAVNDMSYPPAFGHTALSVKNMKGEKNYITHFSLNCNITKKLKSITLPNSKRIHIFALSLEEGTGVGENINVTITADNATGAGKAFWLVAVNKEDIQGRVLATFSDGRPAIAQSRDGRKTVFLYDALTWKGDKDELSKEISFVAKILKKIL